ncbi:MAG: DUF6364 family protein [Gammaproteobacteria bacterium]
MRTTLDINDALLAKAKAVAAQEQTSLTRLIEEGRMGRGDEYSSHAAFFTFRLRARPT